MKKQKESIFTGFLLFIAVLERIYHLSVLPLGLHIDEAGLGLNAWSIANFGTDRYGNYLPVCPSNFYGEQSALYTYLCALFVKIGGLNMISLRLPAVIMGLVAVLFGSLLMKEKWGKKGFYTSLLLFNIFPYFIMNSRFALDCNAMLGAITFALYILVRLLKKIQVNPTKKYYGHFVLVGFCFGLVLYTYIIAAIVILIFSILFGIYYLLYKKELRLLRFKQLLFWALPLCVMVIPLVLTVLVHVFDWNAIVTPFFSIPKMSTNRAEEIGFSMLTIKKKLHGLIYPLTSDGKFGSSDRYWTMYPISIPFLILGGFHSLYTAVKAKKQKTLSIDMVMILFTVAEIIMFFLCGYYNYHINGIFIALVFFCQNGIYFISDMIKNKTLKKLYPIFLAAVYTIFCIGFFLEYYHADTSYGYQIYGGVDKAIASLNDEQRQKEIYIVGEVAEFYFLTNPLSPTDFAQNSDELGYIKDYHNLHFYEPASYDSADILICNKGFGWKDIFSDKNQTGYEYHCTEVGYYCVFTRND